MVARAELALWWRTGEYLMNMQRSERTDKDAAEGCANQRLTLNAKITELNRRQGKLLQ